MAASARHPGPTDCDPTADCLNRPLAHVSCGIVNPSRISTMNPLGCAWGGGSTTSSLESRPRRTV
eukprot:4652786-Prymnesium_polylepis.1